MTNIFAEDFNGDGKLDLAVYLPGDSANSTSGEVRVLLGNGDGTFQAPVVTTLTVAATNLNVGDFNVRFQRF
jgi:FG-GAP-like repeat